MTEKITNQTGKGALGKVNQLLREAQYIVTSIQKNEPLDARQKVQLRELVFLIEKSKYQSTYTYKYWDDEIDERLKRESLQESEALGDA